MTRLSSQQGPKRHTKHIHREKNGEEWLETQLETWQKRASKYTNLDWVRKRDFIDALVSFCEPAPNLRMLDVGTGPGVIAAELAPYVSETIAVDIAEEMIAKAQSSHGDKGITFKLGDVENLDFPDSCFDLVTARMVFHHVCDVANGLAETLRVLRPGGRFVLCEGVPPDHLTRERYEQIFALKEKRHTFSEAELINLFDRTGYENILVRPHFMRQVSLNNWLANGEVDQDAVDEIRRLHVEADDHFKSIYRLNERDGDILMDWKFILIRGEKPAN